MTETPDETFKRVLQEANAGCGFDAQIVRDAVEFRREAYGFTQKQMAEVLGIPCSKYSEFKNGKRRLPRSALIRAWVVGVPAESLIGADLLAEVDLHE